jgi:chromosome segregation ATPase
MSLHVNCEATIDRLKREVEYATARSAAAEKREDELKAELEQAKKELEKKDKAIKQLKDSINSGFAAAQERAKASVLREALTKAAEVFEGYSCHHFIKNADEKAQANRAHAKMCRDALATDSEVKS